MTPGGCFGANCQELIPSRWIMVGPEQAKNPLTFSFYFDDFIEGEKNARENLTYSSLCFWFTSEKLTHAALCVFGRTVASLRDKDWYGSTCPLEQTLSDVIGKGVWL